MIALNVVIIDTKKASDASQSIQVQNLFKNWTFPKGVFLQRWEAAVHTVHTDSSGTWWPDSNPADVRWILPWCQEATSCKLDLIKLCPRLGVPPQRAKIITSQADQTSPAAKRVTQGKVVFDEMQSTVQELSVKHLTTPFRGLSQPHTGAPFKREWSVIEKQARYQNDQHNEVSSMVPRSFPYNHPVWPPFKPHMAPFRTPFKIPIQDPHSKENCQSQENEPGIKMISMMRWVQWYQYHLCMTALYGPCSSLIWPHSEPPFKIPIQDPHSKENCQS